jgi:hypothetical protein
MELKLSMLEFFVQNLLFKNADRLIEVFKDLALNADEKDGILVCNLNPFMVIMQIHKIIYALGSDFPVFHQRLKEVEEILRENASIKLF